METTVSFCGRVLTASELNLARQIITDFPRLSQAELAQTICELLEWRRPNGKLKSAECLACLQKLRENNCLPSLPALRVTKPRGAHRFRAEPQSDPQPPMRGRLADYQPLRLQLIEDLAWLAAYGVRPLLLETLVDRPHTGTCYRAANWIYVGQTQGRGRMDRTHRAQGTCKDILLYPLDPRWRPILCQVPAPQGSSRDNH